jgi:SAM-dependent methyltransferase
MGIVGRLFGRRPSINPPVDVEAGVRDLLRLTNAKAEPNINELWRLTKDFEAMRWNVKSMGYEMARALQPALAARSIREPQHVGLACKASLQADIESDWFAYWCSQMRIAPTYHRKIWEFAYVLQAFYEHGALESDAKMLGFGVGFEPLPSYFASIGIDVLATDLEQEEMNSRGWRDANASQTILEQLHNPAITDRDTFQKHVAFRVVDMNNIPDDLDGYDACWSCCSLEHLGSIEKGLEFIVNSLRPLKPGGLAVHTTEFNFSRSDETIDNWGTVLFQRRHFESVVRDLQERGHWVAPLDFTVGDRPLDRFIDIPPFDVSDNEVVRQLWNGAWQSNHLKLTIDGFPSTSFGLIIRKAEAG